MAQKNPFGRGILKSMGINIPITFRNVGNINDLVALIDQMVKVVFVVASPVAILFLIIAAFLFLTAGGEAQKIATAKKLLFYTLLALAIIVLALAIASLIDFALS